MITFNADEVLEIAETIERNGAQFYGKAADSASGSVADLFRKLAEMEVQHEQTFKAMRSELGEAETNPVTFDPYSEGVLYLQALADGKIFDIKANPADALSGSETPQDVLRTAIGLEKDTVVFYLGLRDIVPGNRGRDRVEDIIQEEMSHVRILSEKLVELG